MSGKRVKKKHKKARIKKKIKTKKECEKKNLFVQYSSVVLIV